MTSKELQSFLTTMERVATGIEKLFEEMKGQKVASIEIAKALSLVNDTLQVVNNFIEKERSSGKKSNKKVPDETI